MVFNNFYDTYPLFISKAVYTLKAYTTDSLTTWFHICYKDVWALEVVQKEQKFSETFKVMPDGGEGETPRHLIVTSIVGEKDISSLRNRVSQILSRRAGKSGN